MEFKKYFVVGTNDIALHDTMNGLVTGELIRCKDCKYWGEDGYKNGCKYATCIMMGNDYCSQAKRKEKCENS